MTKLYDIPFPPILDTSSGDIIREFFNPAFAASVGYDRGVGFFSASWLRLAKKIARLAGRDDEQTQESLKLLLMRRAELLNKAANKIVELSWLIDASEQLNLKTI